MRNDCCSRCGSKEKHRCIGVLMSDDGPIGEIYDCLWCGYVEIVKKLPDDTGRDVMLGTRTPTDGSI